MTTIKHGLNPLPYDPRDKNFSLGAIFGTPKELPTKPFRVFEPKKIKNQGETDKCTSYALSYLLEAHEGVEINPDYLFAKGKEVSGGVEKWGQDLRTACKAPVKFGAIEEKTELYEIISQGRDYSANWRNWGFNYDLAAAFHALWNRGNDDPSRRFLIADDPALTAARLALSRAIGQVIRNGLSIMGVTPVEEMH